MPGPAHKTLVALLGQRPDLPDLLLRSLGHPGLAAKVEARDSSVRIANPAEVRPDLVLVAAGERDAWVIVEVQLGRDEDKQRRWLAAAGALFDARGVMGDVIVITHDAGVARWAAEVAHVIVPNGTRFVLEPVVVQLTLAETEQLLASGRAELAMFAAWAVHDQRGRDAQQVVREAVTRIDAATEVQLRDALVRAMISMLGKPLLAVIREMMMDRLVIPESPGFKALKREIEAIGEARGQVIGEVRGEARALLTVLGARRLPVDEATRTRIERCAAPEMVNRRIERAAIATTIADVFDTNDDAE